MTINIHSDIFFIDKQVHITSGILPDHQVNTDGNMNILSAIWCMILDIYIMICFTKHTGN